MNEVSQANYEQGVLWNGVAGEAWVETQALLDHILRPFEDMLVRAIVARPPARLLDIGCGTGATTIAAARVMGSKGTCLGVDISEPMIERARARAQSEGSLAEFLCADAQTCRFGEGNFDRIVSRFGVMFFSDPVEAFGNLRRVAMQGAELRCFVWRRSEENPFMTLAERTAAPLLPDMPARDLSGSAPGQFAFADPERVHGMLAASGWGEVDIQPVDALCRFPLDELDRWFTRLGPLGCVLHEANESTRTRIVEAVRTAYCPYMHEAEVRFNAACWQVVARATAR